MSLLDKVRIASPCPVAWDDMQVTRGSGTARFCLECKRNVYDISSMAKEQAEALLSRADPVCVQLFRRPDGTIMTRDCGKPAIPVTVPRGSTRGRVFAVPEMRLGRTEIVEEETPEPTREPPARKKKPKRKRSIYEPDEDGL